jgi:hypothetical protein
MKRFLFLPLVLMLGGCAWIQSAVSVVTGTSVTPNQAVIAINAFDAVEATGTQYLQLPACASTASKLCRTPGGASSVVKYIRLGRLARNNLEAAINTGGGAPIAISLYQALTSQTTTLQAIVSGGSQ